MARTKRYTTRSGGSLIIEEADILIKRCSQSDPIVGLYVARELGQAIGISNTTVAGSLMHATTRASTALSSDDENAICTAYPASGNACGATSECPGGLACVDSKCGPCSDDKQCGSNAFCKDGSCIKRCKANSDCEGGLVCRDSLCSSCTGDTECGKGRYCDQDVCAPKCKNADDDCETGFECKSDGRCVSSGGCKTHAHCGEGKYCQEESCVSDSKLGEECQGEGDCDSGQICIKDKDTGKNICSAWCLSQGAACPSKLTCKPFVADRKYCGIKPKPKPKPGNGNGDGNGNGNRGSGPEGEGGGCSVAGDNGSPLNGALFLSLLGFLFILRRRRR